MGVELTDNNTYSAVHFIEPNPPFNVPINSSIDLQATLSGLDGDSRLAASISLIGPITGGFNSYGYDLEHGGEISGSAVASGLTLSPGVEAAMVPQWFMEDSAQVNGYVTGGILEILDSSLFVPGGPPEPTSVSPAPSPEPTTLATFAAALAVIVLIRRRKARSCRETQHLD